MKYQLSKAVEILARTPEVLRVQLTGLSDEWLHGNEGPGTWSPFQVVGHLIINEQTNFLPRTLLVLSNKESQMLQPIDMTSHLEKFKGQNIGDVLSEFSQLRRRSIEQLRSLAISESDLQKVALHPKLGIVVLSNVLSTWVAHDLVHIGQITRVMAKQYKEETGPFIEFLTRLK